MILCFINISKITFDQKILFIKYKKVILIAFMKIYMCTFILFKKRKLLLPYFNYYLSYSKIIKICFCYKLNLFHLYKWLKK